MSEQTALMVIERASIALASGQTEKLLAELAKKSANIVAVKSKDARAECHSALMELKGQRTEIQKRGKAAREDATAYSKAVIKEEDRLIAIIEPEEKRLADLRGAWDAEQERIAEEEANRETARKKVHQDAIEAIKNAPLAMVGKSSKEIAAVLYKMRDLPVGPEFEEFQGVAEAAKEASVAALRQLHDGAQAQETAAAIEEQRIADQRAADERQRQEDVERRKKLDADEAEFKAKVAAQERADRERRDAEIAEAKRAQAEKDAKEAQERAVADAERKRLADEQAERDRLAKVESDRLETEKREVEHKATELMDGKELLRTFIDRFGMLDEFRRVARAIEDYFNGPTP